MTIRAQPGAGPVAAAMLWRRLDRPGHDAARLRATESGGAILEGTAVFSEAGRPCRLDYHVVCDAAWRTLSTRVSGWLDTAEIDLEIVVGEGRAWSLNGRPCHEVLGCDDVDLSFTPATNLLPIRRLGLAVGAAAPVRAAWLRVPEFRLELLEQVYTRTGAAAYRYESGGGAFTAMLETDPVGFVLTYPGLWRQETA